MPKYINAETVGTVLLALEKTECAKNDLLNAIGMLAYILDTKTVDAVEVVRCKDCRFYERLSEDTDTKICSFWEAELGRQAICNFMPTDYCIYGEREESE